MKYFPTETETGEGNGRKIWAKPKWEKRCKGNENHTIHLNASLVTYTHIGLKYVLHITHLHTGKIIIFIDR